MGGIERHHHPVVAGLESTHGGRAEPQAEDPIDGGRRPTAEQVAEHDGAGLLAGALLDRRRDVLTDSTELNLAADAYRDWYGRARKPHYGTVFAAGREGRPEARDELIRLAGDALQGDPCARQGPPPGGHDPPGDRRCPQPGRWIL